MEKFFLRCILENILHFSYSYWLIPHCAQDHVAEIVKWTRKEWIAAFVLWDVVIPAYVRNVLLGQWNRFLAIFIYSPLRSSIQFHRLAGWRIKEVFLCHFSTFSFFLEFFLWVFCAIALLTHMFRLSAHLSTYFIYEFRHFKLRWDGGRIPNATQW